MVDPARVVAANLWIDHLAVVEAKIECVWIVLVVGSGFPGDALPRVFDNTGAFGNSAHRTRELRFVRFACDFYSSSASRELSRKKRPETRMELMDQRHRRLRALPGVFDRTTIKEVEASVGRDRVSFKNWEI